MHESIMQNFATVSTSVATINTHETLPLFQKGRILSFSGS